MGAHKSRMHREGGTPCIWVSAGLLSWYLCDRDLDCDHCPLHHALTRSSRRTLQTAESWPEECRYTSRHLWIRRQPDGKLRVGITPFGAELLNPVEKWELGACGTIQCGTSLVIAHTQAGPVTLTLPFSATVESYNPWLSTDPLWPLADPWNSGYLATLTTNWDTVRAACAELKDFAAQLRQQKSRVGEVLSGAHWAEQAATLAADGGVPFGGLASALGLKAYRALLKQLFGV